MSLYIPPPTCGRVAPEGAVGQRRRGSVVVHPAAVEVAELPVKVQLVSAGEELQLYIPPPVVVGVSSRLRCRR